MMGCGDWGWHGPVGLGHILGDMAVFLGRLASNVLVVLTSGPLLGFLAALVLLLAAIALLKFIFVRRAPEARQVTSEEAK
ncbi:hypothetical protein [Cypionkella sp. TWP1-2-1b2]|uniref:hypothetical protein n=1 Tax=Cypionkella sp. TWP1-2-1b2 TaxID=2804675 RepID=UPI003CEC67D1